MAVGKTFWGLRTSGGTWGLQSGAGQIVTYPAPVAKTGQTQCYKYLGSTSVLDAGCATDIPPNQDGKVQEGIVGPRPEVHGEPERGRDPQWDP